MSVVDHRPPLDESAAAEYVGSTPRHLKNLRAAGLIPFIKVGKYVRYLPDDLDAWLEANRHGVAS